jgi:hypothetical protein
MQNSLAGVPNFIYVLNAIASIRTAIFVPSLIFFPDTLKGFQKYVLLFVEKELS